MPGLQAADGTPRREGLVTLTDDASTVSAVTDLVGDFSDDALREFDEAIAKSVKRKYWLCRKFPNYKNNADECRRLYEFLKKESTVGERTFEALWRSGRATIRVTRTLRNKRSAVTLEMKDSHIGELCFLLPAQALCCLLLPTHSLVACFFRRTAV